MSAPVDSYLARAEVPSPRLHDIVAFRENPETPAAGHVTRVWDRPSRDPYVTISSEGRTFVRCQSEVEVTSSKPGEGR